MIMPATLRLCSLVAALAAVPLSSHADSFTSSASSAGSASSGSVSDSLQGSSNSSTGGDKSAEADYRIIEVAAAPDRPGVARLVLQGDEPAQRLVLDLPQSIVAQQRFARGDGVHTRQRDYGLEFARGDTREPFFLVLADDWFSELAARPVKL